MLRSADKVAKAPHGQEKPVFDLLIVPNVPEVLIQKLQRHASAGASVASQDL